MDGISDLIKKLIQKQLITDDDLANALEDICENVHSHCNSACPVYELNKESIPSYNPKRECICFKCGPRMLAFIRGVRGV